MSAAPSTSQDASERPTVDFPLSDVAKHSKPLGEGRYIQTAACLIIGDEVLNGKVRGCLLR
jgi:hypothetical protein